MKQILLFALLGPIAALAQYSGPAVQTCQAYAEREFKRDNPGVRTVSLVDDLDRNIDRYTRKLGSQFVSSVLYGNGAVVNAQGPSVEFSFVCLLADDKRALFFHWLPRRDAPVLAQCRRGDAAGIGDCLDRLLQLAERDLTQAYAERYVDARAADANRAAEPATATFRRSADTWRAYRDAECARRGAGDAAKACLVELTRRRMLDFR